MQKSTFTLLDGNEAAARVAYRLSETIAIYPITPSTSMGESCDEWSSRGQANLWGTVPSVTQMQSEAGAAGAIHGMLMAGTLTTTFTASQGLLLMIPNMYKIAGELSPFVMHVTARALATHALSIFGDHSDVMACRQTGFAMLVSNSVQEAQDMAAIAHLATLKTRIPFLHFFDGFRTSHEINTITPLSDEQLLGLVDEADIDAFRSRALTPDNPTVRGTAQNPDVFFQAREAGNRFYDAAPGMIQALMTRFAEVTGREYKLFEYVGDPEAEEVVIAMGSGCQTLEATVRHLNAHEGRKVGVLKVRLYRPWSLADFAAALPHSVRKIAVLDRTKEPGALGEPLLVETMAAIEEARQTGLLPDAVVPRIVGGRYGLGSKEFDPAMAKAVYDELRQAQPRRRFTVGIEDDLTHLSLDVDARFDLESEDLFRAVFYGLGSDGTVGANKNTIKIIGSETESFAQAYFVYDSKKSGTMTTSHLRFGPEPVEAPYLVKNAQFVGVHQFSFLERYDVLKLAAPGAVVLLNSTSSPEHLWDHLPRTVQEAMVAKGLQLYVIDAYAVARELGLGARINTIMQTCFFAISGVLPEAEAIEKIKAAIVKTYSRKGQKVVDSNMAAVDAAVGHLHRVDYPDAVTAPVAIDGRWDEAPDFVRNVTRVILANEGDRLPVSAFPIDGTWLTGTTKYEKRNVAQEIPVWTTELCIQCNKCAAVCPHAAIRAKFYPESALAERPETFQSMAFKSRENPHHAFTIQVAPEDCTGCRLCVEVCPGKDRKDPTRKALTMAPQEPLREAEAENFDFFQALPQPKPTELGNTIKDSQFREPLFEFSGACAGCGETPYLKLLTQLYGDRLLIANATGCSSIYGGNLPTTPYSQNADGRGPAWANSLFEDNAEFGLGMRLAVDQREAIAKRLLRHLLPRIYPGLGRELLEADQSTDTGIAMQRERVKILREWLGGIDEPAARELEKVADYLVKKIVWIVGGDGWAYDIGYGGLDHVISSGKNVNILVLDTEVYSNTGGQASKSTSLGAIAKFAAAGKGGPKKSLGLLAMSYGNVYVAKVAMGAKDTQTLNALQEAVAFDGPSLVIAYSHCIAHGFDLAHGMDHQKMAVDTGYWPIYRYDPRRALQGETPLKLDCRKPKLPLSDFAQSEVRYRLLQLQNPGRAKELCNLAQEHVSRQFDWYEQLAALKPPSLKKE